MENRLERLPKVELHLHLEGAIPLSALWTLIEKYGGTSEISSLSVLSERFQFRDFSHFIDTWVWKNKFLREYDDFTFIASAVAEDLACQNIRYVEAFYSPGDFARSGLRVQKLTEAIRKGLDRHRDRITINLIADLIRDFGPERGLEWLHEVHEVRNCGVIGIGLGGSEQQFPPEPYEKIYTLARTLGFRTTAHAGEAAGPESIWGAINVLHVDRIGHGTRAIEDPALITCLRKKRLPVEVCPISNVRTRVVPELRDHPIRKFYDEELLLSVNTDDPTMFQTSLEEEYRALMNTFSFTLDQVVHLVGMAIDASWCDETVKRRLKAELSAV